MSRPIVVGFSTSAASVAALRWADVESRRQHAPLLVVHVHDSSERADLPPGREDGDEPWSDVIEDRVLRCLDVDEKSMPVTISHVTGDLVTALQGLAAQAAMLVVGRAGDCRHRDLAERLRAAVTCPVVAV